MIRPQSPLLGIGLIVLLAAGTGILAHSGHSAGSGAANQASTKDPSHVFCAGRDLSFDVSALLGTGDAEAQSTDPAIALRKFLATQPSQTGWHLLAQTPNKILFGETNDVNSGAISFVITERHDAWPPGYTLPHQGPWGVASWGGCYLQRFNPSLNTAEWVLPGPAPSANAQEFTALVTTRDCSGGKATPLKDITRPEIRYQANVVIVTFFAKLQPPGDYTCQSSPRTAYTVSLPEPLRGRSLLDGGWYPPRPPEYQPGRVP